MATITTTDNKIILYPYECGEVPDFWMFRLINAVSSNDQAYIRAYIPGIIECINDLTDREKSVIIMRYKERKTFKEIGESLNRSYETVRINHNKALRKLRHPFRYKKMIGVSEFDFNDAEKTNRMLKKEINELKKKSEPKSEPELVDEVPIDIEELNLSIRTFNCLKRSNINTIDDLVNMTHEDMYKIRNLGKRSYDEIISKLAEFGITLKYNGDDN